MFQLKIKVSNVDVFMLMLISVEFPDIYELFAGVGEVKYIIELYVCANLISLPVVSFGSGGVDCKPSSVNDVVVVVVVVAVCWLLVVVVNPTVVNVVVVCNSTTFTRTDFLIIFSPSVALNSIDSSPTQFLNGTIVTSEER